MLESGESKNASEASSVKPLSTADMAELLENSTGGDRKKSVTKEPVSTSASVPSPSGKLAETGKAPAPQHPSPAPNDPQQSHAPYQHPQPGAPVASPVIPNFYPHAPSVPPQQQHYGHYAHHASHNQPYYPPGHYPSSLQQLPAGFPQMLSGPSNISLQQQQQQQNQYQTNDQKRSSN